MKRGVGTQGSVMAAFASAWRVWRTKPARPVFEADVLRPHQPKGWWVLTITLRTPGTATIHAHSLRILHPSDARLMSPYHHFGEGSLELFPDGSDEYADADVPLQFPAEREPTAADERSTFLLLYAEHSRVKMRLYWSSGARPKWRKSTTIRVSIPRHS